MREIEGEESSDEFEQFEEIFQTDEDYENDAFCNDHIALFEHDNADNNIGDEASGFSEHLLRSYDHAFSGYEIDNENTAFPALHEIGETIDELNLIMHAFIIKYSLNC